jgi:hypothetical protein
MEKLPEMGMLLSTIGLQVVHGAGWVDKYKWTDAVKSR